MTDRYCVIGNPIAHSKSPRIHAHSPRRAGEDIQYEHCLAPLDGFAATVARLVGEGYKGANVTVPFKLEAARLATRLTVRAQAAGAVNTLVFDGGEIVGDNTDGVGLVADIVRNAGVSLTASACCCWAPAARRAARCCRCCDAGPRQIVIANRTLATAEALVAEFADHAARLAVSSFTDVDGPFDVIINATSASLDAAVPPVPASVFGPGTLALDMMYGNKPTVFMDFAAGHGAAVRDGLGMLVEQAAEAFALWRGMRPGTAHVLASMRQSQ